MPVILINPPVKEQQEASATTGTATAATTEITLTTAESQASVDIESLDPIGSFATSETDKTATFTLTTNNYTGYTLSIKADDDDGTLSAETEGDTLASIESVTQHSAFSAKTAAAAESYNGKWGIKPSKYMNGDNVVTNNSADPVYLPSPTTTPTRLDKTTAANTPNTTNTYTIALGVRADYTVHSGSYARTFQLVALANPVAYSITFNKNTTDTVSNMPANQSSSAITETTITLANTVPTRAHYSFLGWCSVGTTTTNGVDSCAGTIYNPNGNGTSLIYGIDQTTENNATLYAMWKIDTFVQTTRYRYENADGTTTGWTTSETVTVNYGASYSWTTAKIANFNSTAYQAASVASYTVTAAKTNDVTIYRNTFTCTKQYRLQNADGSYPSYTSDGSVSVRYGSSCSYTKSVDYYTSQTASASNVTANQTLSVSLPRTTYTLTVTASTNTSGATGGGSKRWGESVTVSVTKATNTTCVSYAAPKWTASAGTAPAQGASTTFVMPKSNATVTATSTASNVAQTVSLSRSGGANGITIAGTKYTASSVQLNCGTYNISGNFDSGYEFSAWGRGSNVTVANTGTNSTTMTVSGSGSLSLTGKSSKLYMQNIATSTCPTSRTLAYDSRDEQGYYVQKIGSLCWMTTNLNIAGGTKLTSAKSNVSSDYTLPASSTSGFNNASTAYVYNSGSTTCGNNSPCYSYYSYVAATAGTNPSSGAASYDICPKGWRLPTQAEFNTLKSSYTTGATLTGSPWYGVYAGYYNNSSFRNGGSYGRYWSSTAYDASLAYYLYFGSSNANVYDGNKGVGYSVRCVAK